MNRFYRRWSESKRMNHDDGREEQQNWLVRQWNRLRQGRWRDVIIGQVGEGATNVVIGKNNVQINVSGRNLTLPIWLITVALVVIVGFLVYPIVEPVWWPTQMTGQFRIAVADFGEVDARNRVRATARGEVLSKWFFDNLFGEYQSATGAVAQGIEIWHDDRPDIQKNVDFGIIKGNSVEQRRQSAARLAERIDAHMVIYANLIPGADSNELVFEFYLSAQVPDETATLVGSHRLGKPIPLPARLDIGDPATNFALADLLRMRTDPLFWLTVGLKQAILGRSAQALETFLQAEQVLTNWREEDGKEILYFFIGREELFLGQVDHAIANLQRALAIEPAYARAQIALGSAYLKRARNVPPAERFDPSHDLATALDHYLAGLDLARQLEEPLVEQIAHLALAKCYRLYGETYYHLDDTAEARRYFELTRQAASAVIEPLTVANQHRLVAQAFETEGAAYLQEADLLLRQDRPGDSRPLLDKAKIAYQNCIDQGKQVVIDDVLTAQVIDQGCRRYYDVTEEYIHNLSTNNDSALN
jgi:tetratricopeptide (TPR) repeat protein